jgi:hypothetical protein
MIQIVFEGGRYHVQARTETAEQWLADYARDRPACQMRGDAVLIDPRFLSDLIDCARSVGFQVES